MVLVFESNPVFFVWELIFIILSGLLLQFMRQINQEEVKK